MKSYRLRRIGGFFRNRGKRPACGPLVERFDKVRARLHSRLRGCADPPAADAGAAARLIPTLVDWGEADLAAELGRRLTETEDSVPQPDGPEKDAQSLAEIAVVGSALCELVPRFAEFRDPAHRTCDRMAEVVQDRAVCDSDGWDMDMAALAAIAVCLKRGSEALGAERYSESAREAVARVRSIIAGGRGALSRGFGPDLLGRLLDLGLTNEARALAGHETEDKGRGTEAPGFGEKTADLFRWAAIHYRLGNRERAERLFQAGCRMQGRSGGFPGEFGGIRTPEGSSESIEAAGCFLESLFRKIQFEFDAEVDILPTEIDPGDGRYRLVESEIRRRRPGKVLEAGCGSGRFINRLISAHPEMEVAGLDISSSMLRRLDSTVSRIEGSCLNIPRADGEFDLVFSVETLEHAVNVCAALREMARVVRPGGCLLIIDKTREKAGSMPLEEWEKWFDGEEIKQSLEGEGFRVDLVRGVPYSEGSEIKDLFLGWVGTKGGSAEERH